MARWRLTVWSRHRASLEEVWARKTEPLDLREELLPWLRITVEDVDGLRRALRETGTGTFAGRVTGPLGILGFDWPFEIRGTRPRRWYRDASRNLLLAAFEHEHRLEVTGDGLVRYVDEVTFSPAFGPGRLTGEVLRALFVHRHHRAARVLPVDGAALGRSWLRRLDGVAEVGAAAV